MNTLNFSLAIFCLLGGLLVSRAYVMHVDYRKPSPADLLALAIGVSLGAYLCRTTYWDVIWVLLGNTPSNPFVNVPINLGIVGAEYLALKARLLMIPQSRRPHYLVLTCAFYPSRLRLTFYRRDHE